MATAPALVDDVLDGLPAEECERIYKAIRYRWRGGWARPNQLPPAGEWDVWGLVGGRGSGKTRPGAEWTTEFVEEHPGCRFALVGRTARDTRDTMVLGESGIVAVSRPWFRPRYFPSRSLVVWPNGSRAHLYSADEPDLLRGPQHHGAWVDEFSTITKPEAWTNLKDGLRLGKRPPVLLTMTPRRSELFLDTVLGPRRDDDRKRPLSVDQVRGRREWEFTVTTKDHFGNEVLVRTVVRRYRTEENALNLSAGFAARRRAEYGSGSYGQMEMDAEIFDLVEGALWTLQVIDDHRVVDMPPHLRRVVVVDPSHASDGRFDAAGILVLALGIGPDGLPHVYVLDDYTGNLAPEKWGRAAVAAYDKYRADLILYENNAPPDKPDVVPDVIRSVDPKGRIRWEGVYSSKDKRTRADPISSLYVSGRIHHLEDEERPRHLAQLEHEMVSWDPWDPKQKSPNRVDALVHGCTYLLFQPGTVSVSPQSTGTRQSHWRTE